MALKPEGDEYQRLTREELAHYDRIFLDDNAQAARETLLQPVPPSWSEVERRASALIQARTGADFNGHVLARMRDSSPARVVSLGSGPGGIELAFARQAPEAAIHCIDLNPGLVALGQTRAAAERLNVTFETADLNSLVLPRREFDLVLCHASLHHVIELERLAAEIHGSLKPEGVLITVDVCTRNGYLMWPETRQVLHDLWKTLPPRFRINHTAYGSPRLDEVIWEADTATAGMECIRAEEIVPVLASTFAVRHYVPYFSLCRRLLDTMYGPNYNLDLALDRSLVSWIWDLDRYYLDSRRLNPETFFGVYAPQAR